MREERQAAPLFDAADGRQLAEAALRSITASAARERGDDFLRVRVRDLAQALDVRFVVAGRVNALDEDDEAIRTLAVWRGADYLSNMEYRRRQRRARMSPDSACRSTPAASRPTPRRKLGQLPFYH